MTSDEALVAELRERYAATVDMMDEAAAVVMIERADLNHLFHAIDRLSTTHQAIEDRALERAAQLASDAFHHDMETTCQDLAIALRRLKGTPPAVVKESLTTEAATLSPEVMAVLRATMAAISTVEMINGCPVVRNHHVAVDEGEFCDLRIAMSALPPDLRALLESDNG